MPNQEHLDLLKQGSDVWNAWRKQHPEIKPDLNGANVSDINLSGARLSGADLFEANLSHTGLNEANLSDANLSDADLIGADLSRANLRDANLSHTNLSDADLIRADLSRAYLNGAYLSHTNLYGARLSNANFSHTCLSSANLSKADLFEANLSGARLSGADLFEANLNGANLNGANLSGANLSGANLSRTNLVRTNMTKTTLKDCSIYGISAWDVQLDGAEQLNLTITPAGQPTITVDNLKIAQFIYLLLNNAEIRDVINTMSTKSVLILGRFTPERKAVLDGLRDALRKHNLLPILFDFDPVQTQTVRETVRTLAHLSHFIIADLTDPSSIPEELETIVPTLSVPVQPLLELTQKREFSMFKDFGLYPWVLPIYRYTNLEGLVNNLQEKVIDPAIQKARELADKKGHFNEEPFEQTT